MNGLMRIAFWGGLALLASSGGALAIVLATGLPLPWQFQLPAVSLHVGAALAALALGAAQLLLKKGGRRHRLMGYAWCGLLAAVAVGGLAVDLDPAPEPTVIHRASSLFSVATLTLLPIVIHAGRTGRRRAHRFALAGIFGVLFLAGGLSFLPHRAVGGLFVGLAG